MASESGSPPILREDVLRIARLANLDLDEDDAARMTRDLGAILAYVRQLEEVDVRDVEPTAHVELEQLPLRADETRESLPRDLALREAPKVSQDGFAVPAFVDEG
jgi:aspartyl-tRNA(Asn)/glutamyl-tRNA(Gln) amidotransferase subunit C